MEYKHIHLKLKEFLDITPYLTGKRFSWGQHGKNIELEGSTDEVDKMCLELLSLKLIEPINVLPNIKTKED